MHTFFLYIRIKHGIFDVFLLNEERILLIGTFFLCRYCRFWCRRILSILSVRDSEQFSLFFFVYFFLYAAFSLFIFPALFLVTFLISLIIRSPQTRRCYDTVELNIVAYVGECYIAIAFVRNSKHVVLNLKGDKLRWLANWRLFLVWVCAGRWIINVHWLVFDVVNFVCMGMVYTTD